MLQVVVRPGGVLAPATGFDQERLTTRYKAGDVLTIEEPRKPKNVAQERMYRACIGRLAKAIGENPDNLHDEIKLATKRVRGVEVMQGEGFLHTSFRALSCADMDDAAFASFVNDAGAHIAKTWGVSFDQLLDMAGDDLRQAVRS